MSDENTQTSDAAPPSPVTPEAVKTETPAPQLTPAAKSNLEVLMGREKSVRTQEAAVKAQAAELQALREQIEAQQNPVEKDPTALNGEGIESLRAQIAEMQAREEKYRNETVISEERARFRSELSNSEGYEAIKAAGAYDTVFDHVVNHYNETGEYLSEAQAAEVVNGKLMALAQQLVPLLQQAPPAKPPAEEFQTLHSEMTSEVGSQSSTNLMSDAEVMAKAVEMLQPIER